MFDIFSVNRSTFYLSLNTTTHFPLQQFYFSSYEKWIGVTSQFRHINVEQLLQFCQYGKCHLHRYFDNIKHDMIRK